MMKRLLTICLSLAACGPAEPQLSTSVELQGLSASDVQAFELYVVRSTAGIDCTALLGPSGPFVSGAIVEAKELVTPGASATIAGLAPGNYFAVAFAYANAGGVGQYIGQGCAATGQIEVGKVTKVALTLSALAP